MSKDEENQETLNTEESQSEEASSTSEASDEVQQTDQSEEQSQEQEKEAQPTEQGEKKPTRAQRRIQQLLEKVKQGQQSGDDYSNVFNEQEEDFITPEEYQNGIDPQVLKQRIEQREQQRLQQHSQSIKQQLKAEMAYEQEVKSHQSDIDSVQSSEEIKKNPVLERMAVRLYEKENYSVDPRTGQTFFNPVLKLSEALKIVKQDLEEATGNAMASAQVKADENRETAALSPSQDSSDESDDYTEAFERARMSGDDKSWAEVLKKRGMVKLS